jgi:hypothetical protein
MKTSYAVVSTKNLSDAIGQIDYTYARFDGLLSAEVWLSDAMDASLELNSLAQEQNSIQRTLWHKSIIKSRQKSVQDKFLEIEEKLKQMTANYEKKFGYDILELDTEFRIVKVYTFN